MLLIMVFTTKDKKIDYFQYEQLFFYIKITTCMIFFLISAFCLVTEYVLIQFPALIFHLLYYDIVQVMLPIVNEITIGE